MYFISMVFAFLFYASIVIFFVNRHKYKKSDLAIYKKNRKKILIAMVSSFLLGGLFYMVSPQSKQDAIQDAREEKQDDKKEGSSSSSTKNVKKETKNFDYSKYKDFNSEYPNSLSSYNENDFMAKNVKFTGKVYGLSASSLGYQIILKDSKNHLAYLTSDGKQSGKITSFDSLTVYGSTNGTSKISKNDFNRFDNQIKDNDLGKPTILLNSDKIIVHHDTNIN